MRTIQINGKILKIYDSIDEMPIVNFQKYNKYLLIDSGIGSNINDIDEHITKLAKYIKADDKKKALQELQNMRQNMYMINSGISPKNLAFAALVHSINDKQVTDLSDIGLQNILEEINEIKQSSIAKFLMWLKKKVTTELETYFPEDFVKPSDKDNYDKLKERTNLVLESIITGTDNTEQIEVIDNALFNLFSPKSFVGSKSAEVKYDKQFESMCLLISQKTHLDARRMYVLQFYSALNNIKKQAEAEAKAYSKHGKKR